MSAVCIIPARAGSKRIPGKNWKEFCGKPIILYPFKAAKKSRIFTDIFVYTDSEEVKKIIPKDNIIHRHPVSDDETTAEMLEKCIAQFSREYDIICVFYPCAVFATKYLLRKAHDILAYTNPLILNSVCSVTYQGHLLNWWRTEKQELFFNKTFKDAGQFYFIRTEAFNRQKSVIGNISDIVEINAIDINTPEDWANAERLYKYL